MSDIRDPLAAALFSEMFMADQLLRARLSRALPKGMELSHFSVLNLLVRGGERTPAELARVLNVTRGAMTNTLARLERAGHVHVRPDWEDARRKLISISPAGRSAHDTAISGVAEIIDAAVEGIGAERVRAALPVLRAIRARLDGSG